MHNRSLYKSPSDRLGKSTLSSLFLSRFIIFLALLLLVAIYAEARAVVGPIMMRTIRCFHVVSLTKLDCVARVAHALGIVLSILVPALNDLHGCPGLCVI